MEKKYVIGILRETKLPADRRVALTPHQCKALMMANNTLTILVQPSNDRCFSDEEYSAVGIPLAEDLSQCDVLLGIKEVKPEYLLANKTYLFFSHTTKFQAHNRELLKALVSKHIRMVDYEHLKDVNGDRMIGFGHWAGMVGAHYALIMIGRFFGGFQLPQAVECKNMESLTAHYKGIELPAIGIVLTGNGRVGKGALEILRLLQIEEKSPEDFLKKTIDKACFTVLHSKDIYSKKGSDGFDSKDFHTNPNDYESKAGAFWEKADVLINGMFWDPKAPRLFEPEDIAIPGFKLRLISDVTCDIDGSVPLCIRQSSSQSPYLAIKRLDGSETEPFAPDAITLMTIANLPNELPIDASIGFGEIIAKKVLPEMLLIHSDIIDQATICEYGALKPAFGLLSDWIASK